MQTCSQRKLHNPNLSGVKVKYRSRKTNGKIRSHSHDVVDFLELVFLPIFMVAILKRVWRSIVICFASCVTWIPSILPMVLARVSPSAQTLFDVIGSVYTNTMRYQTYLLFHRRTFPGLLAGPHSPRTIILERPWHE
jgi:hypothetical protein